MFRHQSASCAEGWTRVAGHGCYLYLIEEETWVNASALCEQQPKYRAKLAEVDNMEEAEHLIEGAMFSGTRFALSLPSSLHII